MLAGIALIGVVTAAVASWFVERVQRLQVAESHVQAQLALVLAELKELRQRLDELPATLTSPTRVRVQPHQTIP
jgi:voltage-gated potassium channel